MFCKYCGKEIKRGAKFCIHCGRQLSAAPVTPPLIRCPACGAVRKAGVKYCVKCGKSIEVVPAYAKTDFLRDRSFKYIAGAAACFIVLVFALVFSNSSRDFSFKGIYPPVTQVVVYEYGREYGITAVSGHVIAMFNPYVSHNQAKRYIREINGRIVSQIRSINYYLIDVGAGNESYAMDRLRNLYDVKIVSLNMVEYLCEAKAVTAVLDNFYISHGDNVTYALKECGLTSMINQYNVGIKGNENGSLLQSEVDSDLHSILKNAPADTPVVINMSFGPSFNDPNVTYWTDKNITERTKNNYKKQYKSALKHLIAIADNYRDKDFVIVKSAGNEGLKQLDIEILNDLAGELNYDEFETLHKHFILVGAEDSRFPEYSNTVTKGNYNSFYTTVDISDLKNQNSFLFGTSFAAPRLTCFLSTTIDSRKIKATEALRLVKDMTYKNPDGTIVLNDLSDQAKILAEANKSKNNNNNSGLRTVTVPEYNSWNEQVFNNDNYSYPQNQSFGSNLIGTKWESSNPEATAWLSVKRTTLEFVNDSQVIVSSYFVMGSSEVSYYQYYYDTAVKKWGMYCPNASMRSLLKNDPKTVDNWGKTNSFYFVVKGNVLSMSGLLGFKMDFTRVY